MTALDETRGSDQHARGLRRTDRASPRQGRPGRFEGLGAKRLRILAGLRGVVLELARGPVNDNRRTTKLDRTVLPALASPRKQLTVCTALARADRNRAAERRH